MNKPIKFLSVMLLLPLLITVFATSLAAGWKYYSTIPDSTIAPGSFGDEAPSYLDVDSEGNLWIIIYMEKKLYKVTNPTGVFEITLISTPSWQSGSGPSGILCDKQGNVYVTYDDAGMTTQGIYQYSLDGTEVGMYTLPFRPGPIDVDAAGNIYVGQKTGKKLVIITSLDPLTYTESDTVTAHLFRGLKTNATGDTVYTYGDSYALELWVGTSPDAATYTKTTLDELSQLSYYIGKGLEYDGKYLYGALTDHSAIYIYNKEGLIADVIGKFGEAAGDSTGFDRPGQVAISNDGNLMFIGDQVNCRIQVYQWVDEVVPKKWEYYASIPDTSVAPGNFGGAGPAYMDVDSEENLWVVGYNGKTLHKIVNPTGTFEIVPISTPSWQTGSGPSGIVCDDAGNVYATYDDAGMTTQGIYKYSLDGTEIGMYTLPFRPGPIDIDKAGNIYVGEKTDKKLVIITSLDPLTYTESDTVTAHLFRGLKTNAAGDTVYTYGDTYALERWIGTPPDATTYTKTTLDELSFAGWSSGKGLGYDGKYLYGAVTNHEVVYVYNKQGLITDVIGMLNEIVSDNTGFNHPGEVAISADGKYMFVSDQGNDRVQIYTCKEEQVGIEPFTDTKRMPDRFALFQNYPNPFNPSTSISYRISKTTLTKINIYNLFGQKVKTLVNEEHQPGDYKIIWNGTDNSGRILSSGVYIYQLQAGNFLQTKKMVLIK